MLQFGLLRMVSIRAERNRPRERNQEMVSGTKSRANRGTQPRMEVFQHGDLRTLAAEV